MLARLRAAETSFSGIGLPETASILQRARMQLVLDSSTPRATIIGEIGNALSAMGEPIDQTLELFAKHAMSGEVLPSKWRGRGRG